MLSHDINITLSMDIILYEYGSSRFDGCGSCCRLRTTKCRSERISTPCGGLGWKRSNAWQHRHDPPAGGHSPVDGRLPVRGKCCKEINREAPLRGDVDPPRSLQLLNGTRDNR